MEWFGLAKELGRTVAELRATMSIEEFHYWIAFYEILHEKEQSR
jgi:hypothetical protein